ncbi:galactose mutarotase-like domain-containing protein, partial [Phakopsora pachyrhizi]
MFDKAYSSEKTIDSRFEQVHKADKRSKQNERKGLSDGLIDEVKEVEEYHSDSSSDEDEDLKNFPPGLSYPLLTQSSSVTPSSESTNLTSLETSKPRRLSLRQRFKLLKWRESSFLRDREKLLRVSILVLLSLLVLITLFKLSLGLKSPSELVNLIEGTDSLIENRDGDGDGTMFDTHCLEASDGSIYATFIRVGASIQSLLVKDRFGKFRDVVLGYDDTSRYLSDEVTPRFGSIVGRYANRIKNSSFSIPTHPHRIYYTDPNEHKGQNTLHGGEPGWDKRAFKIESKNASYISFTFTDEDGEQGFPSKVFTRVEYWLLRRGRWKIRMTAEADGETPIMLSSHVYWNLDAYNSDGSASDHKLRINAPRHIVVDGILIPTGQIESVVGTPLNFLEPKTIGSDFNSTYGLCGSGCNGYDNALIYDSDRSIDEPAMEMWSSNSGIKMSVKTDQKSVQIYSCNSISTDGLRFARKSSQSEHSNQFYENHSCVVIEQQGFIDGINNYKSWSKTVDGFKTDEQIYGPNKSFEWNSVYEFSV